MLMRLRGFIRNNRGQALVEMALILPFLLMLVLGVLEFGRVLHTYLVVTNAAREGARAGVVGLTDMDITNKVKATAVSLDSNKMTIAIIPGGGMRPTGSNLTVTVSYPVQIYAPVIASIINNPYTVTSRTVMRIE